MPGPAAARAPASDPSTRLSGVEAMTARHQAVWRELDKLWAIVFRLALDPDFCLHPGMKTWGHKPRLILADTLTQLCRRLAHEALQAQEGERSSLGMDREQALREEAEREAMIEEILSDYIGRDQPDDGEPEA